MIERIKRRKELVEGKINLSVKRSILTSININRPVQECILSFNFVPKVLFYWSPVSLNPGRRVGQNPGNEPVAWPRS